MDNLVAWLNRVDDCAIGTVVHVGAGAGEVLEQYAALPAARRPRQVVLIEGDSDRVRGLERAAAEHSWARVRPTPVGAQGGPMPWNRFNLPMLNGPLDGTALKSIYPRLRRVQATTVHCEALGGVLGSLALKPTGEDEQVHVLVLDVPGQEATLLASLSPEMLRQFRVLLIRGCRSVLPPSGQAAEAVLSLLAQQHFTPEVQEGELDTLWPVTLLRFNRVGHELTCLREQMTEAAAKLKERDRTLGDLRAQVSTLTQARATADKLAAERLAKVVEQDERMTEAAAKLKERDRTLGDLQAQVSTLTQARATADKLAAERLAKTVERDERMGEAAAKLKERDRTLGDLQAQVSTLTQARATADKLAAERLAKTVEQDESIRQLEAQLAEANLRLELLQQEVTKAEGQLALLKELLLAEPSL